MLLKRTQDARYYISGSRIFGVLDKKSSKGKDPEQEKKKALEEGFELLFQEDIKKEIKGLIKKLFFERISKEKLEDERKHFGKDTFSFFHLNTSHVTVQTFPLTHGRNLS